MVWEAMNDASTLGAQLSDRQLAELQGMILSGYPTLAASEMICLRIQDGAMARAWLGSIVGEVTGGAIAKPERALQIAFTHRGLRRLGLDEAALDSFAEAFKAGMSSPRRQRILGDGGENHPDNWLWGGPQTEVDALLLLFARDRAALERARGEHESRWTEKRLQKIFSLSTSLLKREGESGERASFVEHFGFRDGLSQPAIAGSGKGRPGQDVLAAGEFVFGYRNEYGKYPRGPVLSQPSQALDNTNELDRNGTYLVLRQLEQHVADFWSFMGEHASVMDGHRGAATREDAKRLLASKIVGRWPNGSSLALSPHREEALGNSPNVFGYHDDLLGLRCPIGSHVRRTNPRDWHSARGPEEARKVTNRHRILRRARSYGPPLVESMRVEELMKASDDGVSRGLLFGCLNTNIERQFEFVQHTWVNNPKFSGLYADADPLVADHAWARGSTTFRPTFVMGDEPFRRRVVGLRPFVRVRGGSYFFLPSIRALRVLARL